MSRSHRLVLFVAATAVVIVLAALAVHALLVILAGVLFALAARGIATFLSTRTRLPYGAAVAIVFVALVGSALVFVFVAGPRLVDQLVELSKRLPDAARELLSRLGIHPPGGAVTSETVGQVADAKTVASGAVAALVGVLEVLSAAVVIFFLGVYGAARPDDHVHALLVVVPRRYRAWAVTVGRDAATRLTRWMLGRLVAMVFVGVTCAIGFAMLQVPLAMSLAVVAGLLVFVEYVGAVISSVPPILMAFTKSPGTALAVAIMFTALHVIEGYVLSPLVARRVVRIPPGVTLAGQAVLATLVGPVGLTFATPLVIIIGSCVEGWRDRPLVGPAPDGTGSAELFQRHFGARKSL
jgi:predicted PurR-regulated permease PerM